MENYLKVEDRCRDHCSSDSKFGLVVWVHLGKVTKLVKDTHGHRFGSDLRGNEHYLSSIKNKT